MRLVDIVMAFPYILLALAIVAVLGPGLGNAILAISIAAIRNEARKRVRDAFEAEAFEEAGRQVRASTQTSLEPSAPRLARA
jgi:peptide/nickel transport system permease protein